MTTPDTTPDDAFAAHVRVQLEPHLAPLLEELGETAPPADLLDQLAGFCAALAKANETINLTGLRSPSEMAHGHVLDSLMALPLIRDEGMLLDLGSGCGVPGVPLALARPTLQVRLCEARSRKSQALGGLCETLQLRPRVDVLHARAEEWLHKKGSAATIVARAVGPVARLLTLLSPPRSHIGRLVLLKGPGADDELREAEPQMAPLGWALVERRDAELPEGRGRRVILAFEPR